MKKEKSTNSMSGNTEGKSVSPKVRNSMNYSTSAGRTFTQPSLTIPDQTMSIKELVQRFSKGLPIAEGKTPIYDEIGNSEGIDLRKLDLSEIHDLKKQVEWKLEQFEKKKTENMSTQKMVDSQTETKPEGQ